MTLSQNATLPPVQRIENWKKQVADLVQQIADWATAQGWTVEHEVKPITERSVGTYELPAVEIKLPEGELSVDPIALGPPGISGRIELRAYPTLNRVRFLRQDSGWEIMTDSGVPLRLPLSLETFVQLAHDLLA
jgi:hypothetical protein